jgi:hypothetical protein
MKAPSPIEMIEAHQKRLDDAQLIPDDIPLMQLADMVVRGKMKLSQPQLRLLIELLPFHAPKLQAVANLQFNFAIELDKKILERSQRPLKLIEASPVSTNTEPSQVSTEVMKKPFVQMRRRV